MYYSAKASINQPQQHSVSGHEHVRGTGYQLLYHNDIENRCPGCGRSQWYIGRSTAECAFCETALPLALVASQPMEPRFTTHCSGTASPKLH